MQFLYIAQLVMMIIGPVIFWAFRLIGIGFVTYVGYNVMIDQVMAYIVSRMGNTGMVIQQILGLAKVDIAINIIFAAVTTRLVISGLNRAQDRRRAQVWRKPGGTSIEA